MRTVESSTSRSIARSTAGGAPVDAGADGGAADVTALAAPLVTAAGGSVTLRAAAVAVGLAAGATARVSRAAAEARACFRSGLDGYSRTSQV